MFFFSNLAGSFGDGLYAFIMPYYMTESLKAGPVEVGILYATASIFAAVTLFAAGVLADKYDRKKVLILGWVAWMPAPLIFAFARDWIQMLPGMALWGVWFGPPTSTAYIVTTVDKRKLTLTFTAISSAWSLGYIFSPALGGYLARTTGMQLVFFLAFIFYVLASFLLFFIRSQVPAKRTQHAPENNSSALQLLKNRQLLVLSGFLGLTMFAILLFRPFIPAFLADVYGYKGFEIGVLGSFAFFGSAILSFALGRIGDRFKKSYALAAALALGGFSLVLLLLFGDFRVLLVTHVFVGASYLTWPLMNAIIGSCGPESARALWIAIPQTVGMLSSVLAPYLGGVLYEVSPYYPFIFGIAVTLFLALLALAKLLD
jgi:DHA1 family tetracycline resistance protein-like MFS transporter